MSPIKFDLEGRWRVLSEEGIVGIKEWRLQHPEATLQEIDAAVDARLADAESFGRLALVGTHRRGPETAHTVCAVSDWPEWIQDFVDLDRPDTAPRDACGKDPLWD